MNAAFPLFRIRATTLLALICSLCLAGPARAAVSFIVSPSAITNDYIGEVTLNITGLSAGASVNVGIYGDSNGNGVIDAGEPLIWSFSLTDGQAPFVAGVRNLNAVGDEDGATNGQIRAVIYIPPASVDLIALGKAVIKVSDPLGVFAPVTQTFTVSQHVYPQYVTGRLSLAGSGQPLTNTIFGLVNVANSQVTFSETDTNGNYLVYCVPGTYGIEAFNLSFGLVYGATNFFSVGCGQIVTNNTTFTNGTFTISGKVTDASTGAGIPGLSVDANSGHNFGGLTFTDTNGNYSLAVTPDTWNIHPSTDGTSQAGYVPLTRTTVVVSNASVPGVNFSLPKPTAMIYGTLKDNEGNPIVGVQLSVRDSGNVYHVVGRSFVTNGNYALPVLPGTWLPGFTTGDLTARGLQGGTSNVVLSTGQATNLNFVVVRTNFPSLSSPVHVSASQFQFLLSGLAGQSYTLQTITNLNGTNWINLLTTNAPCASVFITDVQATNGQRYYRALVVP